MKAFKVFIFGLLYGWFVKIAFDRIYRDNELEDIRNENVSLKEYIRSLENKLQQTSLESKPATRTAAAPAPVRTGTAKDDLKVIKGIGPAIEKKLNAAGIQTFEALGKLTVAELENILGNTKRLVQDEGDLIAQAKKLVRRK
ncbi:MAG TPA: helix-hairpin-helix domain-containing protein [Anaerolineales bacterium]|nr:helix-hairpin-helix domain-containing protein [Anaerolineales bacterium]